MREIMSVHVHPGSQAPVFYKDLTKCLSIDKDKNDVTLDVIIIYKWTLAQKWTHLVVFK